MEDDPWEALSQDTHVPDSDLSDIDLDYTTTRNLDITLRPDYAEFTKTPFTIAAERKRLNPPPLPPRPPKITATLKKTKESEKEGKTVKSKTKSQSISTTNQDNTKANESYEDNTNRVEKKKPEDITSFSDDGSNDERVKKKEKDSFFRLDPQYETWEERDRAQERADRSGGRSILPAIEQEKVPPKDDKKKMRSSYYPQPTGWTNGAGEAVPASRPMPRPDLWASTSAKRKKPAAPPPIMETLAGVDKAVAKKIKDDEKAKAKEKKQSVGKSKGKGKGKGKKDNTAEDSIKFGRLPAGAAANDDYPIVKGLQKMQSLPLKKPTAKSKSAKATIDVDKLVPLTKHETDSKKPGKLDAYANKNVKKPNTFKSQEYVDVEDDDADNESIDPPSEPEDKISDAHWFSKMLADIGDSPDKGHDEHRQEDQDVPSLDNTNPTEPTDDYLTPEATQAVSDNPFTMTHLSGKPHMSDYATSSSQLPYSSPAVQKQGRLNTGIKNPIPVRDKSAHIAQLQNMASEDVVKRKPYSTANIVNAIVIRKAEVPRATYDEDDRAHSHEEEEWSTLKPKNRYAQTQNQDQDSNSRSNPRWNPSTSNNGHRVSRFPQPLFPHHATTRSRTYAHEPPQAKARSFKLTTIFNPTPLTNHNQTNEYSLAPVPNGASKVHQREHYVQEMNWKGTPWEQQGSSRGGGTRPRPNEGEQDEDWRDRWKRPKKDLKDHVLGKYALQGEVKRGSEVNESGRAFGL